MQFAPLDSKMCLVLWKPKNIPQGRQLPPEMLAEPTFQGEAVDPGEYFFLAQSDLPTPDGYEF